MEWIFRFGDFFALLWAFGLATNGIQRNKIILVGGLGSVGTIFISIIWSIIRQDLLFIGIIIELALVLFVSLAILAYLFRNIPKPPLNHKKITVEDLIKDINKKGK